MSRGIIRKGRGQSGYTLLEYCAGAAIIASILWGALSSLGGSLDGLLREVGNWATKRTESIKGNTVTTAP